MQPLSCASEDCHALFEPSASQTISFSAMQYMSAVWFECLAGTMHEWLSGAAERYEADCVEPASSGLLNLLEMRAGEWNNAAVPGGRYATSSLVVGGMW